MRTAYKVLAYLIALEVMIQAAAISYGVFGITKWVEDGATLDKAVMEDESTSFTGLGGLILHGLNGTMIIPLLALVFLILAFFARVPGGAKWAGFVLLAVVVQVFLGIFSHELAGLGILHGLNALILFGLAVTAGMRAGRQDTVTMGATHEREMV
jgi:hypothetical protein